MEPVASAYEVLQKQLRHSPRKWLVTGVAGFIGSNLLETLLLLDQIVVGIDNFSTGFQENIEDALSKVAPGQAARFSLITGDIRDDSLCRQACQGIDIVLQEAALGSVSRSVADPATTNQNNVDGFLNMLIAARDAKVGRFVFASSSSVYGDCTDLPKIEDHIGNPLSPYAVTKYLNELYAGVFGRLYDFSCIGLRYFNVFGRRQNPNGAYAAVIPKWFNSLIRREKTFINGDGATSRDFCFIDNVVQANLLAGCTSNPAAIGQVYNIACGERTTLNELHSMIRKLMESADPDCLYPEPEYRGFLPGDVRHSHADIDKAVRLLGYCPTHMVQEGLTKTAAWYLQHGTGCPK